MHNDMKESVLQNRDWIDTTWTKIDEKLKNVTLRSRKKLPYTAINGVHDICFL